MIPAKSRERKCSTCKHYQASPLWRKGWCRNPLLYDRNTNHLVEADSLACNRTFIDYWEPIEDRTAAAGTAGAVASQPRSTGTTGPKPRVAPSIPMDTVDATGAPITSSVDSTPAMGSSAPARSRTPMYKPLSNQDQSRPPLSLVDDDYDELDDNPKVTAKIPQIDKQNQASLQVTARQRIQQARALRRPVIPQLSGPSLWIALGIVGLIIVVIAGLLLFGRRNTPTQPDNSAGVQTTIVVPSPTGLGDVLATPTAIGQVAPTAGAGTTVVVPSTIAVGGYVKVFKTGDGLVIRPGPTKQGDRRVTKVADGTRLHVIDGPKEADGFNWWKVDGFNPQSPDTSGWCVENYLTPTEAP